jgi:hypothetical protein
MVISVWNNKWKRMYNEAFMENFEVISQNLSAGNAKDAADVHTLH